MIHWALAKTHSVVTVEDSVRVNAVAHVLPWVGVATAAQAATASAQITARNGD